MNQLDRALVEWRAAEGDRQHRLANIKTLWYAEDPKRHGSWEKFCSIELKFTRAQVDRVISGTDLGGRKCNSPISGYPDVTSGEAPDSDLDYDPTPLGWDDEMELRRNVARRRKSQ